jgi:hypothetical protein
MSRCSRSAKVAVVDFDAVADELYAVAPEEFIAARRTREEEARADGDRVLATSISRLPKPSLAAWATNLLVREHREEIESLSSWADCSARRRRTWPARSSRRCRCSATSCSPR